MQDRGERFYHYLNSVSEKMPDGWTINISLTNEALSFTARKGSIVTEVHLYPDDTMEEVIDDLLDNILELENLGV